MPRPRRFVPGQRRPGTAQGRRASIAVLTLVGAGIGVLGPLTAAPAAAAPAGAPRAASGQERIAGFDVRFSLHPDATMHVTETIQWDFGGRADRHGIQRIIPLTFSYDSERNRVYPLSHARAASPSGAPSDLEVIGGSSTTLQVGNANRTVSGVQTYQLDYDLAATVNTVAGGQELYWNATGNQWTVPIDRATVTVTGPAALTRAACYQGRLGSTQTCGQTISGDQVSYTSTGALAAGEGITVVAGFPAGTFPGAAPILREKWKLTKAFGLNPVSGAGAVAVLVLVAGGAAVLAGRRGRDRRYLDVVPGLTPGVGQQPRTARVGVRRLPIAVQFTPPSQVRVGELGTLIDERAHDVDVTATIIDLAVRGYLRIEEVAEHAPDDAPAATQGDAPVDWRLVRTRTDTGELREYERSLFEAIFEGRSRVRLSELRTTFRSRLTKTKALLYREVTERGWFRANPHTVRLRWRSIGSALAVAGLAATVLLAVFTHWALAGLALLISGLVVLVLAGRMPARTAAGTALLVQAQGFRLYLETAEAAQIRFEEGQDVFSRYLPYAIVFGVAERWARVFAEAAAASGTAWPAPTWYVGSGTPGPGPFDYAWFGSSLNGFTSEATSSIAAGTPSSSGDSGFSGGFSGGGGGGGGGGSW